MPFRHDPHSDAHIIREKEKIDTFQAGWAAFHEGLTEDDNPHPKGSILGETWLKGHRQAAAEEQN